MTGIRNAATLLVAIIMIPMLALTCTGFLVNGEDGVLFGNNEDFWDTKTRMWFVPGEGVVDGVDVKGSKDGWTFREFTLERVE